MMAASRLAETLGHRGPKLEDTSLGNLDIWIPVAEKSVDVPGKGTTRRTRKERTTQRNRDGRTMREEKRRQSREPQKQGSDEVKNPTRSGAARDS
ncbi:hypothetical protein NDU88_005220 [Pleurodeles waltl]|uniref:Uncharacterized protein n=1 Tax=Pleurodeles waltl TaxID=8319 RepID=A0AAV7SL64_PLEWA|nr:hypothetical protein NDU88_005220 [Pleurodeles waltl]